MGVKKVSYGDLSPAGKWMRNNPSKVKSQPSRNKPLSAKDKKDKVESQRERRKAKKQGRDIKDKDWDHHTGKFESVKENRGRPGTGGRKKGVKKNFTMKPGSKEVDSPTTFRSDSPLKQLGMIGQDDTASLSKQAYSQPSVQKGMSTGI